MPKRRRRAICSPTLALQPPLIDGDASQLRQVIHNLVQNALDAVPERPDGLVRVRTQQTLYRTGVPRSLRLQVIDNGPGFAEKVLKRAFEPYVTTKTKGTGLGLAVVKKIADEHGARIRLANLHLGGDEAEPVTWCASFVIIFKTRDCSDRSGHCAKARVN